MTPSSRISCFVCRCDAEKSIPAAAGARPGVQFSEFADHPVGFIDPRFRFCGARFRPAAQPFDFRVDQIGQRVLTLALRVQIFFLGLQKFAVVSVDAQEAVFIGAIQLDDLVRDVFQEIAIMADHHVGEGGVAQQIFEPLNSGEIQMIGRLIEQQNIRLLDQRLDNRQALAPSAGERRGQNFGIFKTGAMQRFFGAIAAFGFRHPGFRERRFNHGADASRSDQIRKFARRN